MTFNKNIKLIAFALISFVLISSCKKDEEVTPTKNCTKGQGAITTTTLSVTNFLGIDLAFSSNVTIHEGPTLNVQATGHSNIIQKIKTNVSSGIWIIELEDGCYEDYQLAIDITIPNINSLKLSGSGNILVNNFSNQNGILLMDLSGSGDLTLNQFEGITTINSFITGSGGIQTNQDILSLEALNLTLSGSGAYIGFEIKSDDCAIHSSGSGNVETTVENNLDVLISGSGSISYKGTPTIIQNISGSGQLIDAN